MSAAALPASPGEPGLARVAEDPPLGSRFAVFASLTVHQAMRGTEQMAARLQRFLRAAVMPPLMMISLLALLAASSLEPGGRHVPQAPARPHTACRK